MSMLLKSDRWWSWKIPPMLAFGYFGLLSSVNLPPMGLVLGQIALFLIAAIGIAGFGHLFTDIFDIEEDRRRGHTNLWADSGSWQRLLILASLIAASWLPWLFIPIGRIGLVLLGAEFLMFVLYAVPPIRLKNRGLAGIAADGMYAHALPALWTWLPFANLAGAKTSFWVGLAIGVWGISVGIRELMHHQAIDADRDREAGATTFGVRRGRAHLMKLLRQIVLPVEVISLAVMLAAMTLASMLPILGFGLYMLWSFVKVRAFWLEPVRLFPPDSDDAATILARRILGPFYYGWLPLLLLAELVIRDRSYLFVALLHFVLFGPMILSLLQREAGFLMALFNRPRRRVFIEPMHNP